MSGAHAAKRGKMQWQHARRCSGMPVTVFEHRRANPQLIVLPASSQYGELP
jgi:hypothetical protein